MWKKRARLAGALAASASFALAIAALPGRAMLEKILGQLMMPVGLLWLALLGAALVAWHRRRQAAALAAACGFVAFSLAGNEVVGGRMLGYLERDYTPLSIADDERFDAIFVLGGGTRRLPTEDVLVGAAGDRIVLAARLYHRGVTPLLVASGASIPGAAYPRDHAAESFAIWTELGVDGDDIVQMPGPTNTSEEVEAYAELARERGWRRVALLTSAWHLRRAMRQADRHSLDVTPMPADIRGGSRYAGLYSLIPSGRGFEAVHTASWELVGAALGR